MAEVTLLEQVKLITNPQAVPVHNVFATEYIINSLLPFEFVTGFHKPWTLTDVLPTVNPRDFGADFTSDFGKSSTYNVPWKNYGGKLEVDKALRKGNPAGAAMQELMQVQAIAKQWAAAVFQGTGGTSITGIAAFLNAFFPSQVINAGSTASGDLLTLAMMDEAFRKISNPDAIFMTQIVKDRLTSLARASTSHNVQFTIDQFGVPVMTYNRVPIYNMIDPYDGSEILSVTEIDGAASQSNTSSVYFVKFGGENVVGFSPGSSTLDIETANPGTHAAITRLEMNAGIVVQTPRSAVRIRYVKQAVA